MNAEELNKLITALLVIAVIVLVFNTYKSSTLQTGSGIGGVNTGSTGGVSDVIPTGVPKIYGKELGIAFDDVSATNPQLADQTIGVLGNLDRTLTLEGVDLQRYTDILFTQHGGTSCEFCCGAKSIIFQNGQAACGCAHSYAMRGLTKYLVLNHGDMTDDEILEEVGKWKVLFFPTQMTLRAQVLESQGIETSYINIASNTYRGIEKGQGSGSGMVGGC